MGGQKIGVCDGTSASWREPVLPQPGGRERAPHDLVCVQAFINSHYDLEFDHGADLFATPPALAGWLERRGLLGDSDSPLTEDDVHRALATREGLRTLARRNGDAAARDTTAATAALNQAAGGVTIELRFGDHGPQLRPASPSGLDRALGAVLAVTARSMIDGSWARLKVCPGEDCGWAFYDHSRNQSGRWCSMSVCGGRSKARAHYRRRRGGD